MKILVIGATGMLAKPVIKHLNKQGFDLRLFSRSVNESMFPGKYEIVQGDVFNKADLQKSIHGCEAIHINVSKVDEAAVVEEIVNVAKRNKIQLISYITGCTVAEENRWFLMMDNKFRAEQAIINSGIPYMIFRPTWFFESLELMIQNNKAMVIGKQLNPYRWVAADDYARMVATAYQKEEARNSEFYIFGPEKYLMKDILTKYCEHIHPDIKKVSSVPVWMIKLIAMLARKKDLKIVVSLFSYFEKVKEIGDNTKTNELLGEPVIDFNTWIKTRKSKI